MILNAQIPDKNLDHIFKVTKIRLDKSESYVLTSSVILCYYLHKVYFAVVLILNLLTKHWQTLCALHKSMRILKGLLKERIYFLSLIVVFMFFKCFIQSLLPISCVISSAFKYQNPKTNHFYHLRVHVFPSNVKFL